MEEIYLWRRKKLSLLILVVSTATWVLLDVYLFFTATWSDFSAKRSQVCQDGKQQSEQEWFVFARVITILWMLSYVGSFTDLLTLVYIGVIMGMTVPVIYEKFEDKIKRVGERMRMQMVKVYNIVDEQVIKKVLKKFYVVKVEEGK